MLQRISQLTDSVDFNFQPRARRRLIFNILKFLRFSACITAVENSYHELINHERIVSSQPKYIFKKKKKLAQSFDISFLERRFAPVLIDSLPERENSNFGCRLRLQFLFTAEGVCLVVASVKETKEKSVVLGETASVNYSLTSLNRTLSSRRVPTAML